MNGIAFLNEFRDFCKERANIEKDYANRIDGLVRKYQHKREKKGALNPSGIPTSPIESDSDPNISDGTYVQQHSILSPPPDQLFIPHS